MRISQDGVTIHFVPGEENMAVECLYILAEIAKQTGDEESYQQLFSLAHQLELQLAGIGHA